MHFWKLVRDEDGRIKSCKLMDANFTHAHSTWGKKLQKESRARPQTRSLVLGAPEHYMSIVTEDRMTEVFHIPTKTDFPNLDQYFRFTSGPLGNYFITTGADITTIKKIQEALQESEAALCNHPGEHR